ncbi:hypothetical protein, partial [Nocardia sp. NPDC058497]|uniref:hypothetical protein n=1 Tax=Nocardia sp. NPDC058497 TaxID=3346529 RepID=UPI0036655F8F
MGEVRRASRGRGNRKASTPLFAQLLTAAVDTAADAIAITFSPESGGARGLAYHARGGSGAGGGRVRVVR